MTVGWPWAGAAFVEQVDRAAEDDFLGVGQPGFADQRGQRHQQRQPAGAHFPAQLRGGRAGHACQRGAERPGVQRVDLVQAAADADDLAAEMIGEQGVVGFGVAEDQRLGAERDRSGDQPFDQGGLAGAGLAEDEHAGVGDQPGAQPGQRVEADHLAPQLVPPDRGPGQRGSGSGDERVQAAQLGGGGLVLRARAHVHGAAAVGDLPAPGRGQRLGGRFRPGVGLRRRAAGWPDGVPGLWLRVGRWRGWAVWPGWGRRRVQGSHRDSLAVSDGAGRQARAGRCRRAGWR